LFFTIPLLSKGQDRMIRLFNRVEEFVLGYVLLGIATLCFLQVVLRYGFHMSLSWSEEIIRYSGVFMAYLGVSLGVKYGMHFSMQGLFQYLPSRHCHLLKAIVNFICFAVLISLTYLGWMHAMKLMRFGVLSAAIQMPMYIPYLPIPIFSLTAALRFFALFLTSAKSYIRDEPYSGKG